MYFLGMNNHRVGTPLVLALLWIVQASLTLGMLTGCVTPSGKSGKCILFHDCKPLVDINNNPNKTPHDNLFLAESKCNIHLRKPLVCCPVSSLPEYPNCGTQLSDRIVGGQLTAIDEFPWTALIEYEKPDGSFGFHCGGALINERYIVTAAHCITSIPRSWKLHRVRLGEWDLASALDCQVDCLFKGNCTKVCWDAPIDLDIEQVIKHENYDTKDQSNANDIALIRFTRPVRYSETVRPICLPLSNSLRERKHVGYPSYAAGWGKTEQGSASEIKLKVELKVQDAQTCFPIYNRGGIFLKPTHMCAGGVRGEDTCSGDSGGPLMRQMAGAWYLIGVVSFGPKKCGTAGVPGVYTNMAKYVDWIKNGIY